jgi:hypothetical protein
MTNNLALRRKWTFRAHGKQMVFVKKTLEGDTHVLAKALLWALFLPEYPELSVEIPIGNRYKPDLVQLDDHGTPAFWGEAGKVGARKIRTLVRRFRSTHLVFAKWNMNLLPIKKIIQKEIHFTRRQAPIDLIAFPPDSDHRFILADKTIQITLEDIQLMRYW